MIEILCAKHKEPLVVETTWEGILVGSCKKCLNEVEEQATESDCEDCTVCEDCTAFGDGFAEGRAESDNT